MTSKFSAATPMPPSGACEPTGNLDVGWVGPEVQGGRCASAVWKANELAVPVGAPAQSLETAPGEWGI